MVIISVSKKDFAYFFISSLISLSSSQNWGELPRSFVYFYSAELPFTTTCSDVWCWNFLKLPEAKMHSFLFSFFTLTIFNSSATKSENVFQLSIHCWKLKHVFSSALETTKPAFLIFTVGLLGMDAIGDLFRRLSIAGWATGAKKIDGWVCWGPSLQDAWWWWWWSDGLYGWLTMTGVSGLRHDEPLKIE